MAGDKAAARKRALEAKAKLDAKRAAADAMEVEKTAEFYAALDRLEAAKAAVEKAQGDVDQAVLGLAALGKTAAEIAVLTGLETSEIRRIKRAQKTSGPGDAERAGVGGNGGEGEDRKVSDMVAPGTVAEPEPAIEAVPA